MYKVVTEEFRDVAGVPVEPRLAGSIGADVYYAQWGGSTVRVYDLKTYGASPRPISAARQDLFTRRFGSPAQEIFMQR
jgi:hypothetical protein